MRRLVIVMVLGLLVGCDAMTPAEELTGTWAVETSTSCAFALTFKDATKFESDKICSLTDGSIGQESFVGTYVSDGHSLTTTISLSTCPNTTKVGSLSYSISGSALTLLLPTGIAVLQKQSPGNGTIVTTFGCYASDGSFTPGPLVAVP